jgi:hypothetical protein
MRLNIAKRLRIVTIYIKKILNFTKNKFEALILESSLEDIFATKLTIRLILKKHQETAQVCHKTSIE